MNSITIVKLHGGYYDNPSLYVKAERADRFGLLDCSEEYDTRRYCCNTLSYQ